MNPRSWYLPAVTSADCRCCQEFRPFSPPAAMERAINISITSQCQRETARARPHTSTQSHQRRAISRLAEDHRGNVRRVQCKSAWSLGRAHPEDFRTFFIKITALMTDHAADQRKLRALFEALKKRMDREVRGENVLLRLVTFRLGAVFRSKSRVACPLCVVDCV
ncbi:hypothetical protein C8R47DRAFT_258630 [Mycena vitilis]|nr:hypothetical protein C8R47DRAFT_258630 [Mycena vitilis]